jgi:hypothetical protein
MSNIYQARWATKDRVRWLKKTGALRQSLVLDSMKGYIVVEPSGSRLGDGKPLSRDEADFELSQAWCRDPRSAVTEARKRLGLSSEEIASSENA